MKISPLQKLRIRIRSRFVNPRPAFVAVLPQLESLQKALAAAKASNDPVGEIVKFFDETSKWHDRGISDLVAALEKVNYGQHDALVEDLKTLELHFENAGRSRYGINRTEHGQKVTDDKVFLGGVYGVWTLTVAEWKGKRDDPGILGSSTNAFAIVADQARGFMDSHIDPMVALLNRVVAFAR